jgi:hypothetical protein
VTLINADGMAFIGPGSEWFWSAAQFLVVAVTLFGIYRQLRGQAAANAVQRIESLHKQWSSGHMSYTKLVLALHLKYEAFGSATWFKAQPILDFFGTLADLYDEGYISLDELGDNWGRSIQIYWAMLAPAVNQERLLEGLPLYEGIDTLITLLRAWEAKRGITLLSLDPSTVAVFLDHTIQQHIEALRQEQGYRSGVIPSAPDMPPVGASG